MVKITILLLGWLSLALGTLGVFLPLLPTVPFWLLSAWCFSKTSKRWHDWVLNHPWFGPVINNWQSGKGIPSKVKWKAIGVVWLSMIISMLLMKKLWICLMLITIGFCVSFYLWRLPTKDRTLAATDKNKKLSSY